jgi:hypothetical protein
MDMAGLYEADATRRSSTNGNSRELRFTTFAPSRHSIGRSNDHECAYL